MTIREQIEAAKQQEYLTAEQFALLFQYHIKSVYRKVERHEIPGVVRIGRRTLRFRTKTVLAWGRINLESRDIRPAF